MVCHVDFSFPTVLISGIKIDLKQDSCIRQLLFLIKSWKQINAEICGVKWKIEGCVD